MLVIEFKWFLTYLIKWKYESHIKKIKNITADHCITIIMNSHRTRPDSLQDEVRLKNHIKTVDQRLRADTDKRTHTQLMDQLNRLAERIDHSLNLDSLILFVNEDMAEFSRLRIPVEDRVVIDDNFATRDLVRAMHLQTS